MQLKHVAGFLALFTVSAISSPINIKREALDVWSPTITSPTTSTVWEIGTQVKVTWYRSATDTSDAPASISNGASVVLLVHDRPADVPKLAEGFNLRAGSVEVTVPDVTPGSDYSIQLFGDSGNVSDKFTIKASA
ncbi:hypothetical protein VKT23_004693 [Stygiomarasmius scandens]|uniref:Yeast cell wall synthesis Kre9/Knh1-like N-terminal domain-containing protein n=1 Tax=Marasmiellus scandens TaxID=2682957 RepID=A0ABR1JUS7_9AGAR